jgi:CheY-like chemotaxis protein
MCRLLYVEDDEEDMFLFDKAINDIDRMIEVDYAMCAEDLYYFLEMTFPDYLFLDLNLPGETGLECLKKIRRMSFSIPVIIFTVSDDQKMIDECYQARANYYIQKPRFYTNIVKQIDQVLHINWKADRYPAKERFVIL